MLLLKHSSLLKLTSFLILLSTLLWIHHLILIFAVYFLQVLRSDEIFDWSECFFEKSAICKSLFLSSLLLHFHSKRNSFHQLKEHVSFNFNCKDFVTWIIFINVLNEMKQSHIFQNQINFLFKSFINLLITVEISCCFLLFSQLFYSIYHENNIFAWSFNIKK